MFKDNIPIYQQIKEIMVQRIVSGVWKENDLIPSVRTMAKDLGVNPNTVMRTVNELQNENILVIERGIGNNVAQGAQEQLKKELVEKFKKNDVPLFVSRAKMLSIRQKELAELVNGAW